MLDTCVDDQELGAKHLVRRTVRRTVHASPSASHGAAGRVLPHTSELPSLRTYY